MVKTSGPSGTMSVKYFSTECFYLDKVGIIYYLLYRETGIYMESHITVEPVSYQNVH